MRHSIPVSGKVKWKHTHLWYTGFLTASEVIEVKATRWTPRPPTRQEKKSLIQEIQCLYSTTLKMANVQPISWYSIFPVSDKTQRLDYHLKDIWTWNVGFFFFLNKGMWNINIKAVLKAVSFSSSPTFLHAEKNIFSPTFLVPKSDYFILSVKHTNKL